MNKKYDQNNESNITEGDFRAMHGMKPDAAISYVGDQDISSEVVSEDTTISVDDQPSYLPSINIDKMDKIFTSGVPNYSPEFSLDRLLPGPIDASYFLSTDSDESDSKNPLERAVDSLLEENNE